MKKIIFLLLFLIVVVLVIIIVICHFEYKLYSNNNTQLSDNEYIITTDFRWKTMMNDGGSNTNIYYKFNFDNNIVAKEKTGYHANLVGIPNTKNTTVYAKEIPSDIKQEDMSLINELLTKEDINDTKIITFLQFPVQILINIFIMLMQLKVSILF